MKRRAFADKDVVTIKDALGLEWDILEARESKYGFDILYGRRHNPTSYECGGPLRLIYTNELKAFWEKNAIRTDGTIFDLPAGRTTLKRARVALGFNWDHDSERFWRKRKNEMLELKPREFEQKYKEHRVTRNRMSGWRFKIFGRRARPIGWWKDPDVLRIFLSGKSLNQMRAILPEKISVTHASRLRRHIKSCYELRNGEPIQIAPDSGPIRDLRNRS